MKHEYMRQDSNNGAMLNVDNSSLEAYKKQRELKNSMRNYNSRLDNLEITVKEIKDLLTKVLENGNIK